MIPLNVFINICQEHNLVLDEGLNRVSWNNHLFCYINEFKVIIYHLIQNQDKIFWPEYKIYKGMVFSLDKDQLEDIIEEWKLFIKQFKINDKLIKIGLDFQ